MQTIEFSDLNDPRLMDYMGLKDLQLRSRTEVERGIFLAESKLVVERALRAGLRPLSFMMSQKWLPQFEELELKYPYLVSLPVFVGSDELLQEVTGFHLHRGMLATFQRPVLSSLQGYLQTHNVRRVAILEDIVDHTNVGAIFRNAAGLGVDLIVVTPRCSDPLYRRSVRVSMGTVFQVPWVRSEKWPQDISVMQDAGFKVAALALGPLSEPISKLGLEQVDKLALIFGSEGPGLKPATIAAADYSVVIPMAGGVDSLNVSASAAIAFWELCRGQDAI